MRREVSWLVLISLVAICITPAAAVQSSDSFITAATGISLSIDFGNGTILEYSDLEGTNAFEVTNSTIETEVEWFGNLVYVSSIGGVGKNELTNQYWLYRVNGNLAGSASNVYILNNGDAIEWIYTDNTSDIQTEPTNPIVPQFDYSLAIGGGVLAIVAIGVLLVLWLRQNRR